MPEIAKLNLDWLEDLNQINAENLLKLAKDNTQNQALLVNYFEDFVRNNDVTNLNPDQQKVYELIEKYYSSIDQAKLTLEISKNCLIWKSKNKLNCEPILTQLNWIDNSAKELSQKFLITRSINELISNKEYENRGYSIEKIIRTALWSDTKEYKEILNRSSLAKESIEKLDKWKLERALSFSQWLEESWFVWKTVEQITNNLPWLEWIYLWDIPISFIQVAVPWADIDKSVALFKWIKEWWKWEFKEYYEHNKGKWKDLLANQYSLINMLSKVWIKTIKWEDINKKILELSGKQLKLVQEYIEVMLVPNLKILNNQAYNIFEKWLLYIFENENYGKGEKLIEILNTSKWKPDLKVAEDILNLLKEKVDKWYNLNIQKALWETQSQVNYILNTTKNQEVLNSISTLSWTNIEWINKIFSILWDCNSFIDYFWIPENLNPSIEKVFEFIKNWNVNALKKLFEENKQLVELFKVIWTKDYTKFKIKNFNEELKVIEKNNESENWKIEKLDKLPELSWKSLKSFYENIIKQPWMSWINLTEIVNSINNAEDISINSLSLKKVEDENNVNTDTKTEDKDPRNTYTKEEIDKIKSFAWNSDKIIRLWQIEEDSFFLNKSWKKENISDKYDLFMKNDWSLLIIPLIDRTIESLEFQWATLTTRPSKLSIVIPYWAFSWWWIWILWIVKHVIKSMRSN